MAKTAPRIGADLLEWAESRVGTKYDIGMCAQWVIRDGLKIPPPWKWGGNGKPWAMNYALAASKVVRTTDPTEIPAGAIGFLDGGRARAGHIFISDGDGWCYSTDGSKDGVIGRVRISTLCSRWNLKVWGYVVVDGMDYTITVTGPRYNNLDPASYPPKGPKSGPQILWLGQRLVAHGFDAHYKVGPTSTWGEVDRKNLEDFQRAQGWTGKDADGYPGPTTLKLLNAEPVEKTTVRVMFTPLAGYNGVTKPGVTRWKKNTDGLASLVRSHKPDLLATTELSNRVINRMRPRLDKALTSLLIRVNGGSDGRYIYRDPKTTTWIAHKLVTTPKSIQYRGDDKQGFMVCFEAHGIRGVLGVFHAENEDATGNTQVKQCLWFADQVEAFRKAHGVKPVNVLRVMDSNSRGKVRKALEERGENILIASLFTGWTHAAADPYDLAASKGTGTASVLDNAGTSDHQYQLIDFQLTAA